MANDSSLQEKLLYRALPFLRIAAKSKDLSMVVGIVIIMSIIIVPLPSFLLDFFLAISISLAVLTLLISLYIPRPTDLSTFPTLILIVTLFRLSLNVATTRMILTHGHEGPEHVSAIVTSFGQFVVGGNYVIGIIVFLILVIINFMVITKGAGRVSEVTARFTLDAMPGKQMAIDADMNAGLIDEHEAKKRRQEIISEASFYGSMDGASKFVSGDAVAGIIITMINIIGGFLIGVFQHDLSLGQSAEFYTILTIGDGLVAQLPALISSTATGIIITRTSKEETEQPFAERAITQLTGDYKILFIVGSIMLLFAAIPGLPTFSLGFVGMSFMILGYLVQRSKDGLFATVATPTAKKGAAAGSPSMGAEARSTESSGGDAPQKSPAEAKKEEEEAIADILKVELLELDVGYGLIRMADAQQGGDLLDRIKSIRRKIAADFGFVTPQVRIRDNLNLRPNDYEFMLKGISIGRGEVYPDKFLAMNSGLVTNEMEGIPTKEPAFGLDALWINKESKEEAIVRGYTVVDPSTVMTTHLSELIKKHAEEVVTRQDIQTLIDKMRKDYSVIVDDVLKVASLGLLQRVLKALLHEKIPIKDLVTILETVADVAEMTKNVDIIVEQVRSKLFRVITNLYKSEDGTVKLLTFNTASEQQLMEKVKDQNGSRSLVLSVGEINTLVEVVGAQAQKVLERGVAPAIVIVDPSLRKSLAEMFERFGLDVVVLSHAEVDPSAKFEVLGTIEL